MSGKYRSIKKCPTFTKEIITFDKKGRKTVKTVEISNHYLLVLHNGNSVVVSQEQLAQFGISDVKIDTKVKEVVIDNSKVEEPDEDLINEGEDVTETVVENTGLINGSVN